MALRPGPNHVEWVALAIAIAGGPGCRLGFDRIEATTSSDGSDAPVDAAPDTVDAPPPDTVGESLRLWLTMDETLMDGIVHDASGNHNDAVCSASCPSQVQGHSGLALSGFSSSVPGIQIGDATEWRLTTFTLTAWVYLTQTGDNASIVSKPLGNANANSYQLIVRSTGELSCVVSNTSGETHVFAPSDIASDRWIHTACTYDGSALRLFMDGMQVAESTSAVSVSYDGHALYIGSDRNSGSPANAFDGHIDDVRVFSTALASDLLLQLAR
jgi:hypothetical protein